MSRVRRPPGRRTALRSCAALPALESRVSGFRAVLSPCTGVCTLGHEGYCLGCLRTGDEIARWLQMSDDERLRLVEHVLPQRDAERP